MKRTSALDKHYAADARSSKRHLRTSCFSSEEPDVNRITVGEWTALLVASSTDTTSAIDFTTSKGTVKPVVIREKTCLGSMSQDAALSMHTSTSQLTCTLARLWLQQVYVEAPLFPLLWSLAVGSMFSVSVRDTLMLRFHRKANFIFLTLSVKTQAASYVHHWPIVANEQGGDHMLRYSQEMHPLAYDETFLTSVRNYSPPEASWVANAQGNMVDTHRWWGTPYEVAGGEYGISRALVAPVRVGWDRVERCSQCHLCPNCAKRECYEEPYAKIYNGDFMSEMNILTRRG